jgi:hypothetical protein
MIKPRQSKRNKIKLKKLNLKKIKKTEAARLKGNANVTFHVKCEVLIVVLLKVQVFADIILC